MKKLFSAFLCLTCLALVLSSCVKGSDNQTSGDDDGQNSTPEIVEPAYTPEFFTGYEKTDSANPRAVAVMVNNIVQSRPQRGISQADILVESKVEGGITRFMAIFSDYENVTGDIGPVRSGRDQFLQLAMPWHALYIHVGRSGVTQTMIDTYEYNDSDADGYTKNLTYRDENRKKQGYSTEHTAFTTAELLNSLFTKYDYETTYKYGSPCFDFVRYDENNGIRQLTGDSATSVSITHSRSYATYFDYDESTGKYDMSQWNSLARSVQDTKDENDGTQLSFENVFVLFADIEPYPYPGGNLDSNGNDKGDPDYQKVDYSYGGIGYYFSNGNVEKIRWFKGGPTDMLKFTDMDENSLKVNCGKSYIGIVDLDEYEKFEYAGVGGSVDQTAEGSDTVQEEIGD